MIALARHCDPERIAWTGVALTDWAQSDSRLCREMQALMPIFAGPARGQGLHDLTYTTRLVSAENGIARVMKDADIVLAWGIICPAQPLTGRPRIVLVSHGSCPWPNAKFPDTSAVEVVAVSEAAKQPFPESIRSRIEVIPNGIEVERCQSSVDRNEVRAAWGFGPHHKLVGYVGRFSREKNPLAVANAVKFLGGDFRAVYIGAGRHEAQLMAAAVEIAGPSARLVGPVDQIGNALGALDVMILASPHEGFSLALAEAWFVGVPTVASRVGAVPELEQRHGRLVVPVRTHATARELGEAVLLALSRENGEVVRRAQAITRSYYTSEAMAGRWSDYLCRLCPRP